MKRDTGPSTLHTVGPQGSTLSWQETYCSCGASADRPGFKAPPGWYKCPQCRQYTPRHMLTTSTAQRFGGGLPEGLDPYLRFYLPSTGNAAVSPAYDPGWTDTSGPPSPQRLRCVTTRINSVTTSAFIVDPIGGAGRRNLFQQWVSDPIKAGPITGTIKGQARVSSDTPNTYRQITIVVKVFSNDGSTVRGRLISIGEAAASNPFSAALTNRISAAGNVLAPVTAQLGDRLVFELGAYSLADPIDVFAALSMGDNSATDLPVDETTTAAYNPWIQLTRP